MHSAFFPVALVLFAIWIYYFAESVHKVVIKIALVNCAICPHELSFAMFNAILMLSACFDDYPSYEDWSIHF